MNKPVQKYKIGFTTWLEWFVMAGAALVAAAAVNSTFVAQKTEYGEGSVFSQFASRADALGRETDPVRRDAMCIPLSSFCRSIDAQIPTNSRIFLLNMLGPENQGNLGYYFFLNNYLYPREVAISLGKPVIFGVDGMSGRNPASMEELAQAGYDLVLKQTPDKGWQSQALRPMPPRAPETKAATISETDPYIAFLLPLALALAGSRMVRWLFKDLKGSLTTGELLATGLAVGMFLLTQLILLLRMIGARLEPALAVLTMIWAAVELLLLIRSWKFQRPQLKTCHLWWLLLVPTGLMFWCLFRLAGLEGLLEFDAVGHWELKAKLFYHTAGKEIWAWTSNPEYSYAHLDYPLTVTLLYSFTYGALGHVNEFVIKFWNQWMLLFLVLATLGSGQFPHRRPWLMASTTTIIILLPITLLFARKEGGTIPLLFYVVLASTQLALGLVDKNAGRLRLGLFLLMGAAMVKFEGRILLGLWIGLLLLDKEGRTLFWPVKRLGIAALVGIAGWLPYIFFRSHISVVHPDDLGLKLLMHNWQAAWMLAPMTWVSLMSRRFFNNDFASWSAPDNLHAVWDGKWMGLQSFVDEATLGVGWVCLLVLAVLWLRGQYFRRVALCFLAVVITYSTVICIAFLSVASQTIVPTNGETAGQPPSLFSYTAALKCSETISGGRFLYPLLMSCLVAGTVLLARRMPGELAPPVKDKQMPKASPRKR